MMSVEHLWNLQLVTVERLMVKSNALVRCVEITAAT
jgi:hypothetical protein